MNGKPKAKRRGRGESRISARLLAVHETHRKAAEMRAAGYTLPEIAAACGYKTTSAALKAVEGHIRRTNLPIAEEVRKFELQRLAVLEEGIIRRASGASPAQTLITDDGKAHILGTQDSALDRVVKIHERRARLLGIDAPTRVDTRNTFTIADMDEFVASVRAIVKDVVLTRCGAEVAAEVDVAVGERIAGRGAVEAVAGGGDAR